MVLMNLNSKLIVIVGPTAIGKTKLSIELAQYFNTEIISADSRQFYKELQIGTASPSKQELDAVNHNFIGNLSVNDYYNVSIFEKQALALCEKLFVKSNYIVAVGGSGLYISSLCEGIDDLPDPKPEVRDHLKELLDTQGIESLRLKLKNIDPEYYSIADLANPKRIMRALEVFLTTGQKYSELRKNETKIRNFKIVKIGLNRKREELFDIINKRVDDMIIQGLIQEAKLFYNLKHLNALNTVGYKELFDFFDNKMSLDEAIEKIKTNTRRYAKRQLTWFKKDQNIKWFYPHEKHEIIKYIENF